MRAQVKRYNDHFDEKAGKLTGLDCNLEKALVCALDYALTKPDVRIVSAIKVLQWMQNPVPLRAATGTERAFAATVGPPRIKALTPQGLRLDVPLGGLYTISIYQVDGRRSPIHPGNEGRFPTVQSGTVKAQFFAGRLDSLRITAAWLSAGFSRIASLAFCRR